MFKLKANKICVCFEMDIYIYISMQTRAELEFESNKICVCIEMNINPNKWELD